MSGTGSGGPDSSQVARFAATLPFPMDDFQERSCRALEQGLSALVAAPTGSGKTVVGLFGVYLALSRGRTVMYTTPIKALSNQKFQELRSLHGEDQVGLLTGDVSIHPEAPVLVMTTEVLRNMIYSGSHSLEDLDVVVMDEVHYLADRFRGPVWEEVIIHLPERVQLISLSATVSNAEEFGAWLREVRGPTEIVVWEHRPVPLWQHMLVRRRLYDLTLENNGRLNPQLLAAVGQSGPVRHGPGRRGGEHNSARRVPRVSRAAVVDTLDRAGLLPAIVFIFSRAGCEGAVDQVLASGIALTSEAEARQIRQILKAHVGGVAGEDLAALGFSRFSHALERGVAAHHAGLIPLFKEIVEELFVRGLLKVVYATETLALGINMPARTVVLERLVKWNGSQMQRLTPGEYTQLTGRAGRRGIDVEGHGVVIHGPGNEPDFVLSLASNRTYPLRSAFRATYNMAVNLLATMSPAQAREVLLASFAQFQADKSVVGPARQVRQAERQARETAGRLECDRGDLAGYARLRGSISRMEQDLAAQKARALEAGRDQALAQLRTGDVVRLARGRRSQHAVVCAISESKRSELLVDVVGEDGRARRLKRSDFPSALAIAGNLPVGRRFNTGTPRGRKDLAALLRSFLKGQTRSHPARPPELDRSGLEALRAELRAHPCHSCPDIEAHMSLGRQLIQAENTVRTLTARISGLTGSIAAGFDKICLHLTELGYLSPEGQVTPAGRALQRTHCERDIIMSECLRSGVWRHLGPAELAGAVSAVVYESRGDGTGQGDAVPSRALRRALADTFAIAASINESENRLGIQTTPEVDAGLAGPIFGWASGGTLAEVLASQELLPGDFVRWCRQVLDVLQQLIVNDAAPAPLRETARLARAAVDRGVVALSSAV